MLFMGEEWGASTPWQFFTDHAEPELAEAIRSGRAEEFGGHGWAELYGGSVDVPDPQAASAFEASRLDWTEPGQPGHARLLAWYRDLAALRRREPDLASGDRSATRVEAIGEATVVHRGRIRVVANRGGEPTEIPVGDGPVELLAAWEPVHMTNGGIRVPGRSVVVVRTSTDVEASTGE
jgi:maltooligosyltrehalose trehalohydrolase